MMKETGYPFRGWLSSCSLHEVNFYSSLLTPWNAKSIMTFWVMFRVQWYSDKEILSAKCFSPSQVSPSLSKISLQVSFHNKIILHSNWELHALPHLSWGKSLLFYRWAWFANGHFIAKCVVPLGEKIILSPAHASSPGLLISGVIMFARVICMLFKWYANVLLFFFFRWKREKVKSKKPCIGGRAVRRVIATKSMFIFQVLRIMEHPACSFSVRSPKASVALKSGWSGIREKLKCPRASC